MKAKLHLCDHRCVIIEMDSIQNISPTYNLFLVIACKIDVNKPQEPSNMAYYLANYLECVQ